MKKMVSRFLKVTHGFGKETLMQKTLSLFLAVMLLLSVLLAPSPPTPEAATSTDPVTVNFNGVAGQAQGYFQNLSTGSPQLNAPVTGQTDHRGTLYLFKPSATGSAIPLPGQEVVITINARIDNIYLARLYWWVHGLDIESLEVRNVTTNERYILEENASKLFDSGSLPLEPGIKARLIIKGRVKSPTPATCPCYNEARIKYLQGLIFEGFREGDPLGETCGQTFYLLNSSFPSRQMVLRAPRLNGTLSCELGAGLSGSPIFDSRDDLTPGELQACQDLLPPSCLGF